MKQHDLEAVLDARFSDDKLYTLTHKAVKGKVKRGPGKGQRYRTELWYFTPVEDEVTV